MLVLLTPVFAATHLRVQWQAGLEARLLLLFFSDKAIYRETEEREDENEAQELK